jgi:hypothetical protein
MKGTFMRKRTWALFLCVFAVSSAAVFGGGRQDNESHTADDPSGFTESINIENKKPGKWNIFLEAHDKGGNTTVAGPHNVYIDPESDLPVAKVINPMPNMHVRGNLNIVGTCTDDDGVAYVELEITRGSDGKGESVLRARAEGADCWSYFLDTSDTQLWRDGIYTISAWGIDINGLSGISKTFQVVWILDRKKPEITVTSHDQGALVKGRVSIKGTVWDGNGIDSLSYSLGDGSRYLPVNLKYDRRTGISTFDIPVDTRTFADGPAVILLKAKDTMRNEGIFSFLIFVNNTGPEVQINYPAPDEAINGIFTVAGYAYHNVGIASLSWKLGKESGELPLIVGNPWWVKEFDIRGQNVKNLDLEIMAVDISGNVTVAKRRLLVDQEADLPNLTLNAPTAGFVIPDTGMPIAGFAADNDGVASIFYSLNGATPVEIPCSGYFQFLVPDIPIGIHNLDVWAKDITGVTGRKVTVKGIVAPGPLPEPRLERVRSGSGKTLVSKDFFTGIAINPEPKMVMEFAVKSAVPIANASVSFANRPPAAIAVRGGRDGFYRADVPVPADLNGLVKIELRAGDRYNREGLWEDFMYIEPHTPIRQDRSSPLQGTADDRSFRWVRADIHPDDGRILFSRADEILVGLGGSPLQRATLSGEGAEIFQANVDEHGRLQFKAGDAEGNYGPLQLTLTDRNGMEFTTAEYRFLVDHSPPNLHITENPDWVQNQVWFKFTATDANNIKSVDYNLNLGPTWQPLMQSDELSALMPETEIERTLDISAFQDGLVTVAVRIIDEANRETVKYFSINKDTKAPEARLIVPVSEARVNGTIRLGIAVSEAGKLASVTYERPASETDGEVLSAISKTLFPGPAGNMPLTFLDVVLDSTETPLCEDMRFVFTDAAGNTATLSEWPFIIDREMDLPVVQISLPLEDEIIVADFVISGISYDDDDVRNIYWRLDDGDEQILETKLSFSIPVPLSSITDNEHSVSIYAEDIFGVKGHVVTRNFRVSLEEPKASLTQPALGEIVGGMVTLAGVASDKNGIKSVQISLDNGNSFNDSVIAANADGGTDGADAIEWTYQFNSKIIQDGPHVVFIRVSDRYDISSLYSSMLMADNTPPELVLDTPVDGAVTTGPLYFTGRAIDAIMLESVTINLSSLEGVAIPPELAVRETKTDALLLEDMDISSLPNGSYNVEIRATDKAGNVSRVSRNIALANDRQRNFIDLLYPLDGEYVQGYFNLYGYVEGIDMPGDVTLLVNDTVIKTGPVSETGYFRFAVSADDLAPGENEIVVSNDFGGRETARSAARIIQYQPLGPWITVDTMNMGDFAYERPWLMGRAGYVLSDEETAILADKKADKELKAAVEAKRVDSIELSFDNGRTFSTARKSTEKNYNWRYRIEDWDMREGIHYLVIRATMRNGEKAVTRFLIQIDNTPPEIRLISPEQGGRYNYEMQFAALASDDVELKDVSYHLRQGDKAAYEVPGFIKGLYVESTIPPFLKQAWNGAPGIFNGGATYMDFGLGLSFFDDNVKIQVVYGFISQSLYTHMGGEGQIRYGGQVLGLKLLANIYTLSFGTLGGPDWNWLSASFAMGANFSLFDIAREGYTQSGNPTWMSALLAQIEFPRVTIPKRSSLRTFSLFTEGQLWFVPTDVDAKKNNLDIVKPHLIVGLRMYIF